MAEVNALDLGSRMHNALNPTTPASPCAPLALPLLPPEPPNHPAAEKTPVHRDGRFRRLWAVGLLSSLVRWIDVLSFSLVTYEQTHSAFWVACMMMLRMVPLAILGVVFGDLSARYPRRRLLLICQGALLGTTLALLLASVLGVLQVWHLALAAVVSGIMWSGDMPMRRAFMGDVVGAARMGKAMALDSVASNGSRLIGPSLGGLLLAAGGMSAVLLVDVLMYGLVLWALLGLREPKTAQDAERDPTLPRMRLPRPGVLAMLVSGWRTARETPRLTAILCNTLIFNIFCWPVLSMVPVIAQQQLQLGTQGTGLLASMDGLGSLLGALLLTVVARRHGLIYMGGTVLFLAMLPLFALSRQPLLSAVALTLLGVAQGAFAVMQSTLTFLAVPPERRLQAMGLVTTCIGIAPLGFVLVGALAEWLGAPGAAMACSAGGFVTLALTRSWWRPCVQAQTA